MNSLPTDVLACVLAAGYDPLMTLTDESGEALAGAIHVWRGEKTNRQPRLTETVRWNRAMAVLARTRAAGYAPLMTLTDESGEALADAIHVWQGEKAGSPTTSAHWNRPME